MNAKIKVSETEAAVATAIIPARLFPSGAHLVGSNAVPEEDMLY